MEELVETCCLCNQKGDINLFEHKMIITDLNDENSIEYGLNGCKEIQAIDLFKIYKDLDIDNLCTELKLLCLECLEKLSNCYEFYRNIKQALAQKQQHLMKATQKLDSEHLEDFIIEETETNANANTYEDALVGNEQYVEETTPHVQRDTISTANLEAEGDFMEGQPNDNVVETSMATKQPEINVVPAYENAVAMDYNDSEIENVTSYVVHFDNSCPSDDDDGETILFDERIIYQTAAEGENIKENVASSPLPDQKRTRQKVLKQKLAAPVVGPTQPPHQDASLVVTQFLPVKTQMRLETSSLDSECENQVSTQDLSTVDFAAVELKSCNFQQSDNGGIEIKSNVFCNESADDDSSSQIFVCKYCPQAFAASHYLIAHVRKSHVCKYCTKAFEKTLDLYVHIRQAHYQHKCAICQKELSSQSNLRGHIKRVHGIRLPAQVALLDYRTPNSSEALE